MKKISINKLLKLKNINIIDIRDEDEYNIFNINNSINIPNIILYNNYISLLDKSKTYYIVCDKGVRSKKMVKFLNKKKYNVVYVKGGIHKLNTLNF